MKREIQIYLDEVKNENCECCNPEERKKFTEDDLCTKVFSVKDEMSVRCVGEWAIQKIYYLVSYFNIFVIGMKDAWDGNIFYIEICSGPGKCINRKSGTEFNGTSLSIVKNSAFQYLKKAIFFDNDQKVVDTLNKRLDNLGVDTARAYIGDYNKPDEICEIITNKTQKKKGLFLIFIDPTDCGVPFDLVRTLHRNFKKVDFIVNLPIGTDFNRNIKNTINNPESYNKAINKYSSFLGTDKFYNDSRLSTSESLELRNIFREYYHNSFRNIGYKYFDSEKVENYYDLFFASSHEKGLEFWKKADIIRYDGQRKLIFDEDCRI